MPAACGLRMSCFCPRLNRGANARISPATANIPRHGRIDRGIVGCGIARKQRSGRHDLTRLTETALNDLVTEPCLLNQSAGIRSPDRFDGCDLPSRNRPDRKYAGTDRTAVDMNGAGATLGDPATEFGAGEAEQVA